MAVLQIINLDHQKHNTDSMSTIKTTRLKFISSPIMKAPKIYQKLLQRVILEMIKTNCFESILRNIVKKMLSFSSLKQ